MEEEKINEVNAHLALAEYKRKERLENIINESFWHYYFGGIVKIIVILLMLAYFFTAVLENPKTAPFLLLIYFIMFTLVELNRQHCRFNALIKLLEIEKEKNKNQKIIDQE